MTIRYVNTAADAGGNGTTNETSGDNRAYATLAEWETAEDGIELIEAHVVYCTGIDTGAIVVIDGWMGNSATNTITISAHSADRHNGTRDSGYTLKVADNYASTLQTNEEYVYFDGISATNTGGYEFAGISIAADNCHVIDCLVYDVTAGGNWGGITNSGDNVEIINTVVMECPKYGIYVMGTTYVYNCTVVASGDVGIFVRIWDTGYVKNCYSGGSTNADYGEEDVTNSHLHCTNCMASDTSFAVNTFDTETNCTDSIAYSTSAGAYFTNVTSTSQDVHIGASSSFIEAGADLEEDAHWVKATWTDWEDGARDETSPDIGADEYVSIVVGMAGAMTTNTGYWGW